MTSRHRTSATWQDELSLVDGVSEYITFPSIPTATVTIIRGPQDRRTPVSRNADGCRPTPAEEGGSAVLQLTTKSSVQWTLPMVLWLLDELGRNRKGHGFRHLKEFHRKLADGLNLEFGLNLNNEHVANKLKGLEKSYKKHIDHENGTGRGAKQIEFEEELANVFGKRRNVNPEILLSQKLEPVHELPTPQAIDTLEEFVEEEVDQPARTPTQTPTRRRRVKRRLVVDVLESFRKDRQDFYKQFLENQHRAIKAMEYRNELMKASLDK